MKPSVSYFHIKSAGDNLSALRTRHRRMFSGNELAVLKNSAGKLMVKVSYPLGTAQPAGTLTMDEAKAELRAMLAIHGRAPIG